MAGILPHFAPLCNTILTHSASDHGPAIGAIALTLVNISTKTTIAPKTGGTKFFKFSQATPFHPGGKGHLRAACSSRAGRNSRLRAGRPSLGRPAINAVTFMLCNAISGFVVWEIAPRRGREAGYEPGVFSTCSTGHSDGREKPAVKRVIWPDEHFRHGLAAISSKSRQKAAFMLARQRLSLSGQAVDESGSTGRSVLRPSRSPRRLVGAGLCVGPPAVWTRPQSADGSQSRRGS